MLTRTLSVGMMSAWFVATTAATGFAEPAAAQLYTDRAHWFSLQVPEGWAAAKGQGSGPVLTVRSEATPTVQLTLEIRRLTQLPELITRERLVEQAQALLKAAAVGRRPVSVTEVTGRPMAGLIADYLDDPVTASRVTILLDPPRQRAFVWIATAPPDQFSQYDLAFDQVVVELIPALPES